MKKQVVLILMLFFICLIAAQTIPIDKSITKFHLPSIMKSFEELHQLNFSYDADAIDDILIEVESDTLSLTTFIEILNTQTGYQITKTGDKDFLLLKKDTKTSICGVVIDASSGFELSITEIIINNKIKAITDPKGFFEFTTNGIKNDSVSFVYLGYRKNSKRIRDLHPKHCDTIRLTKETLELTTVIVQDYLTSGIRKNVDGSVFFSSKKLKILPGLVEPDVFTGLQSLPGINSPTEDAAALYIRGGTPDQNLVLFDGIKMYQTGHFFDQISSFNPYIIGETNVYRGGTSVRYGDRLSGVIDIRTDDQILDSLVIGGGMNLTHGDVFIKSPITKNSGFLASLRRSTIDLYDNIVTENLIKKVFQNTRGITNENTETNLPDIKDKSLFTDINFKYLWYSSPRNVFKFSAIFIESRLDNLRIDTSDPMFEYSLFSDALKIRNLGSSLQWKKTGKSDIIQNASVYVSYYDQRYDASREIPDFDTPKLISNNIVNDFGGEYSIEIPTGNQGKVHLGYQLVRNKTSYFIDSSTSDPEDDTNTFTNSINGQGTNYTLFSEYRFGNSRTYYNLGFRSSYLSNIKKLFVEPRAYISSEISTDFWISGSLELKNQQLSRYSSNTPFLYAVPGLPISDNEWLLSNSIFELEDNFDSSADDMILPVLKSTQITLGALWKHQGWNFDIEGYYKRIRDIGTVNDIVLTLATPEEIDKDIFNPIGTEDRIGIDFLAKKTFRNYRFWLGYSLSRTFVNFSDIQNASFPNLRDQRHVLHLSQTLKVKKIELALGWRYASGAPFTRLLPSEDSFLDLEVDPNGINSSRFPDYHRLDFSIRYRFRSIKNGMSMVLGSSIRNLYNRTNTLSQGFESGIGEFGLPVITTFRNESLALTPDVVFRITF